MCFAFVAYGQYYSLYLIGDTHLGCGLFLLSSIHHIYHNITTAKKPTFLFEVRRDCISNYIRSFVGMNKWPYTHVLFYLVLFKLGNTQRNWPCLSLISSFLSPWSLRKFLWNVHFNSALTLGVFMFPIFSSWISTHTITC